MQTCHRVRPSRMSRNEESLLTSFYKVLAIEGALQPSRIIAMCTLL